MKMNLLFTAALLLSTAAFAQQADSKNSHSEKSPALSAKAGGDASLHANTSAQVKPNTVSSTEDQAKLTDVSAGANSRVNAGPGNNKLSSDASLNSSLVVAKTSEKSKTELKKTHDNVKSAAHAGSSAVVRAGTGIQHAVKPRPVSFKMQSQIKTNAGIRIK